MENIDLKLLMEMIALKKEKPEEYKEFLKGMKGVMKDLSTVTQETVTEMEKELHNE